MAYRALIFFFVGTFVGGVHQCWAVETGRKAAMKYFTGQPSGASKIRRKPASLSSGDRLFSISAGTLVNGKSYEWAGEKLGGWNAQVAYQRATRGYFAQAFQFEFQKFTAQEQEFSKLSVLLSFVFPRSVTFPVYMGVAAGPGFFLKQLTKESNLSIDYKGYVGLRLNQEQSQFILESGVKNHVHMLSDGQFIGWFVSSGIAYKF